VGISDTIIITNIASQKDLKGGGTTKHAPKLLGPDGASPAYEHLPTRLP
jgi:hypothetical protein